MTRPVFALLSEAEYRALLARAQREGTTVNDLVAHLARQWLAKNTEEAS